MCIHKGYANYWSLKYKISSCSVLKGIKMQRVENKRAKVGHTNQQNCSSCAFEISVFLRHNIFAQKNQASPTDMKVVSIKYKINESNIQM